MKKLKFYNLSSILLLAMIEYILLGCIIITPYAGSIFWPMFLLLPPELVLFVIVYLTILDFIHTEL